MAGVGSASASGPAPYGGRATDVGAADVEREKAYALAETLNAQLDDISRNLSSMIGEVNTLSCSSPSNPHGGGGAATGVEPDAANLGALRVGGKESGSGLAEDPVSQIASILNAHLASLKWIDESSGNLRDKLEALRRGQIA